MTGRNFSQLFLLDYQHKREKISNNLFSIRHIPKLVMTENYIFVNSILPDQS